MKTLQINVNKNEISQEGKEYITSGGYKSVKCVFDFSEEWAELSKTALFLYNGVSYNDAIINNECYIPAEAIENKGTLSIGVFGTTINSGTVEKRLTTGLLQVQIYEGSFIPGEQPVNPSPSAWEEYIAEINRLIAEAEGIIEDFTAEDVKFEDGDTFQDKYDNGELKGPKGDPGQAGVTDYNELTNKPTIPAKLSDLINDTNFINNTVDNLTNYYTKANTYNKTEVNNLIASVNSFSVDIVNTLPTQNIDEHTIYMVPKASATSGDSYDEYLYISNAWEKIGSTEIDLSNYYNKSEINTLLAAKQNAMSKASSNEIITGTDDVKYTTALGVKAAILDALSNYTVGYEDTLPIGTVIEYDGNTVPTGYEEVPDRIGDLSTLNTTSKTNVVSAINELVAIAGTWTPVISTLENVDPTITYTAQKGNYYKIGNLIYVDFYINGKITAVNGSNNYGIIKGLPFAASTINNAFGQISLNLGMHYNLIDNPTDLTLNISGQNIRLQRSNGANAAQIYVTPSNYFEIGGSGWYRT